MIRLIIIILIGAGLYFMYVNKDNISTSVDQSMKQTTQELQNEKTINSVGQGRERAAQDAKEVSN